MKRVTTNRRSEQTESDKKDKFFLAAKRKRKVKLLERRISGIKKVYKHTLFHRVDFSMKEVFLRFSSSFFVE